MAKGLGSTLTKIPTSSIADSSIGITSIATSGSASASTFLHGDLSWGTVSVGGKINTKGDKEWVMGQISALREGARLDKHQMKTANELWKKYA